MPDAERAAMLRRMTHESEKPLDPKTLADLAGLRAELDRIDDALYDLLAARARIVRKVAAAKPPNSPFLRPGREAQILRRLIARGQGAGTQDPPPAILVRIMREIIAGLYDRQGGLRCLVYAPRSERAAWDCARDHFSSQADLHATRDAQEALNEAGGNPRSLAILEEPIPADDPARPTNRSLGQDWWIALTRMPQDGPKVIARLPVLAAPSSHAAASHAPRHPPLWIVGRVPPEPSGDDCTVLALCYPANTISQSKILSHGRAAGLELCIQSAAEEAGLRVSGWSADRSLVEMIELPGHPWFVACQFHPEFTSTPRDGHPLFSGFVEAAARFAKEHGRG